MFHIDQCSEASHLMQSVLYSFGMNVKIRIAYCIVSLLIGIKVAIMQVGKTYSPVLMSHQYVGTS